MRKNILITGMPRSGKSTILKEVIITHENKVGFVTNEIRENGERVGFEIETHLGTKSMLADVKSKTNYKVSRYFVHVKNLDEIIPEVTNFSRDDILFLDEIGQMELFSEKFRQLVLRYLDSPNTCIATLSKVFADDFIEKIKNRDDIILIEINQENRGFMKKYIETLIRKIAKAKRYAAKPERFAVNSNGMSIKTDHGIRHLKKLKEAWICECEFFRENQICSHIIAAEEFLKKHNP